MLAASLAIIFYLYNSFIIERISKENKERLKGINNLQQETTDIKQRLASYTINDKTIEELEAKLKKAKGTLGYMQERFSNRLMFYDLFREITNNEKIKVIEIKVMEDIKDKAGIVIIPISIKVEAEFRDIYSYINSFDQMDSNLLIKDIKINSVYESLPQLEVDMLMNAYIKERGQDIMNNPLIIEKD